MNAAKPRLLVVLGLVGAVSAVGQNVQLDSNSAEYRAALKLASEPEPTVPQYVSRPVLPEASVKQIGQETFRTTIRKLDGWYDTRLPYVPGCRYDIHRTDANAGKYEFVVGGDVRWYDAGFNTSQSLDSGETGTIKLRVNDESPYAWMLFEISRSKPLIGACYAPKFAQIPFGQTICDVPILQIGDDTPAFRQGLNSVAPLFGAQPVKTLARVGSLSGCGVASSPQRADSPPPSVGNTAQANDGQWHHFGERLVPSQPSANGLARYSISVDPSIPLEERIRRGNYGNNVVDVYAKHLFTSAQSGERYVTLYKGAGYTSVEALIRKMRADGYSPATADDAIAIGYQHPELQDKWPIVFLGSVITLQPGRPLVPVLGGGGGPHYLSVDAYSLDCRGDCRYAAVRGK